MGAEEGGKAEGAADPAAGGAAAPAEGAAQAMEMDDDVLLQQALAMSMGQDPAAAGATASGAGAAATEEQDPDLALALQMSMQDQGAAGAGADAGGASERGGLGQLLADQAYMQGVLGSLPGVDPNDPGVQAALGSQLAAISSQGPSQQQPGEDGDDKEGGLGKEGEDGGK